MLRRSVRQLGRRLLIAKSVLSDVGLVTKQPHLFACLLITQFFIAIVCILLLTSGLRKPDTWLPRCPQSPQHLVGPIEVKYTSPTFDELEKFHAELTDGGFWRPSNCSPIHQVALVVPFRNREYHLRTFLAHMHPFLQKQQLDYGIYVVEQASSNSFNRGMLMNIGFVEALKQRRWQCFIFHDVDLLPEDDRNVYSCPEMPRHMSVAVDTMAYRLIYDGLFGGIEAFTTDQFILINGFSNKFFGWGGEDDDLYQRITDRGLNLTRYPRHIGRYRMLHHDRSNPGVRSSSLLKTSKHRMDTDGLSSLNSSSYVARIDRYRLYTKIYADINQKYVAAH